MKYYVVTFSNGDSLHGFFNSFSDCLSYLEDHLFCGDFTVEEFDSKFDYINNL